MALAVLGETPKTPEQLAVWSFVHMSHHRDIIRVIFEATGLRLDEWVIDPFDPNSDDTWIYQHAIMHNQMDSVLGIAGYDLSTLDWQDPEILASWINANQTEHYIAGNILGLG